MNKKILLSIICNIAGFFSLAQKPMRVVENANLLYLVDEQTVAANRDYLASFIEWALKSLQRRGPDNEFVFDTVRNMNILLSNKETQKFTDAFTLRSGRTFTQFASKLEDATLLNKDSLLLMQLYNFQYFLLIKVNVFRDLLEYQFILSKIDPTELNQKRTRNGLPYIDNSDYNTASVFIDPTSANYKEKLMQALKQLIVEANEPPKPHVQVSTTMKNDTIYSECKKTIDIEIFDDDKDSPKDQITFKCSIKSADRSVFNTSDKKSSFSLGQCGVYSMIVTVSDGIESGVRNYVVVVQPAPLLYYYDSDPYYFDNSYNYYSFNRSPHSPSVVDALAKMMMRSLKNVPVSIRTRNPIADIWRDVFYRVTPVQILVDAPQGYKVSVLERKTTHVGGNNEYSSVPLFQSKATMAPPIFFTAHNSVVPVVTAAVEGTDSNRTMEMLTYEVFHRYDGEHFPSTTGYRIEVESNGIISTRDIGVNYHKMSPIVPMCNVGFVRNDHAKEYQHLALFGIGGKLMIGRLFAVFSTVELSSPLSNSTTPLPFNSIIGGRTGLNVTLLCSRKAHLAIDWLYFNHPVISRDLKERSHVSRAGVGLSSMLMGYSYNHIASPLELYVAYYSRISIFNQTVADLYEAGLRFNLFFEQRAKTN